MPTRSCNQSLGQISSIINNSVFNCTQAKINKNWIFSFTYYFINVNLGSLGNVRVMGQVQVYWLWFITLDNFWFPSMGLLVSRYPQWYLAWNIALHKQGQIHQQSLPQWNWRESQRQEMGVDLGHNCQSQSQWFHCPCGSGPQGSQREHQSL